MGLFNFLKKKEHTVETPVVPPVRTRMSLNDLFG
jgi:hypothetical protein